jgi:D-alanyl-lipoteichoic acid acyltransferase DltB (MBOAT superfamily)
MGFTFLLVAIGWVFFRAENIGQAVEYLRGMFNPSILSKLRYLNFGGTRETVICLTIMFAVEWLQRHKQHGLALASVNKWLRRIIYILIILSIILFTGKNEQFIYFQF